MDEFAMGSSSERCAWGIVKNPIDTGRVPGGSSGGSAASVVMGGALGSFGSDTGGSIRQPASFCGLVGLKPTYGAVSRHGLMALASSLDQIGPFARTVRDAKILFDVVSGYDTMDSTTVPEAMRKVASTKKQLTIGVPESLIAMDGIDEDVRTNFRATLEKLKARGHVIKNIDIPMLKHSLAVYYIIMPAEASANLARFDGIRYGFSKDADTLLDIYMTSRGEGFGKETRRRVLLGTYVLSAGYYDAYYNKAVAVREKIRLQLSDAFTDVDVIATPTSPSPAFKIGEKTSDPLKMYIEDIFTVSANIAGIPGISIPAGSVVREGKELPVGIQFMANKFEEDTLFLIGSEVERSI
jgi:aspartyl-tRNA(Asn)/glutamyl-tRNA(Gln) amidotransferase subunit A